MRFLSFVIIFLATFNIYAQSPHGDNFNIDCSNCHQSTSWKINSPQNIKFDHSTTGFPLEGQHKIINCQSCHTSLVFSKVKNDCISCHTDIHQGTVGFDCAKCHNSNSWVVSNINEIHEQSRFPLVGVHLQADCIQCHAGYNNLTFEPIGATCYDCHKSDYESTSNPNHMQAGFSTDCEQCHSITGLGWPAENFNHDFFPLVGGHKISNCFSCHQQGGDFSGLSTDCYSCHRKDFENTTDPNHVTGGFSTNCVDCHTINGWSPANFDHSSTGFPLTGQHASVNCQSCHTNGFSNTPTDCFSCHEADYNNTTDPNHAALGYPHDCSQCHSTNGWDNANFDHNLTSFPLTGQHTTVSCQNCHTNGYANTPTDCYSCHESDYNNTNDPNHAALGYPHDCTQCHSTNGWDNANFDHNNTGFPLTGQHTTVSCQNCHTNGYTNTPTDCYSCHETDYNNTNDPNHVAEGYPHDCSQCHSTNGWDNANFDHNNTGFPLTGQHTTVSCQSCHTNGYTNTPTDCYSCHESDYNNTTDPNHVAEGYSHDCTQCHTTNGWDESNFDHNNTGFPLTGQHTTVSCQSCHTNGYTNTPTDCYSCHESDYNNTTDPNHLAEGYPHDCTECHSTQGWDNSTFDHNNTNFPLTGAHVNVSCSQCHANGFNNTPTDCYSCHESDFNNTTDPNHVAEGYPHDCSQCHSTNNWDNANFDHNNTNFPLTGAHVNVSCSQCHQNGYSGTPTECYACHESDFNNTTDPPHVSENFSHVCTDCHTTNGWTPATFDHSFYPIGNHHSNVNCNQCHSQSNYQPQCLSCHQSDFNNGHNSGDPTDCWNCHNTNNWDNASFNHDDFFPLTGAHLSVACNQCHTDGYSNTPTECNGCHQSNYNGTNNPNHQNLGISTDCQTCHTTNSGWSPATFPQHSQYFELLGAHLNISNCNDCHNGNYVNPPNTCYGCHDSNYNSTTDPPHQQLNFDHDCTECHNMNDWTPATFDHSFYALSSHHTNINCSQCHSESNYQPQCLSCHLDNFLDGHNQGDRTDCWSCHSTFNFGDGPVMKQNLKLK